MDTLSSPAQKRPSPMPVPAGARVSKHSRPRRATRPFLAGMVLAFALTPAVVLADDLMTVYRLAREHDPKLQAAEFTYQAGLQKLPQARALLLPTISATARKNRNRDETVTDSTVTSRPAGSAEYDSTEYALNLTQPVFNSASLAEVRRARADVRRAEAERLGAQQDLMLRVVEAYLNVLAAADGLELARAEKAAVARNLETVQGRLQVGLAAKADVHEAKARYELAAVQEVEAENELEDRQEALRELTGRRHRSLARLAERIPLASPAPPDVNHWVQAALTRSPVLVARREIVESAREDVKRSHAGHYPSLDVVGSRTRTDADASISGPGIRADNTVLGLQLTIPLIQGGLVSARTAEAGHRLSATEQELEGARRNVERTVRSAFLGVVSGVARVNALQQAVTASESALQAKSEGFKAGVNTLLDVLDANRELYRAKRDHARARYGYALNWLRLKQNAGTLSEDDVAHVNGWLQ